MHNAKMLHGFSTSNLSIHLMPRKAASQGLTEPRKAFAHCLVPALPWAVWASTIPAWRADLLPKGINTWVPSSPHVQSRRCWGCSLDLGDVKGSQVLQVSCSWRDSTRNWSSGLRLSFKLRGRQKANIWEKRGNKRFKWPKADFLSTKCHTDILLAEM